MCIRDSSIALGSADLTLLEMLHAYSMFPNRGFSTEPIIISRIEDKNGNVLESFQSESKQVISEADAYTMYKMMQGVIDFGTGHSMRGRFGVLKVRWAVKQEPPTKIRMDGSLAVS